MAKLCFVVLMLCMFVVFVVSGVVGDGDGVAFVVAVAVLVVVAVVVLAVLAVAVAMPLCYRYCCFKCSRLWQSCGVL